MATTYTNSDITRKVVHSNALGNRWRGRYTFSSVWDGTAADILRFGIIPAGTEIDDCIASIADCAASSTLKLGWAYVDGANDSAGVSSDDDFFFAATDVASGPTTVRKTNAASGAKYLEKDAYLIGTGGGAANSSAIAMDIIVLGEFRGTK